MYVLVARLVCVRASRTCQGDRKPSVFFLVVRMRGGNKCICTIYICTHVRIHVYMCVSSA